MMRNTQAVVLVICPISLKPVYLTSPLYEPVIRNPKMKSISIEIDFCKKTIKVSPVKSG